MRISSIINTGYQKSRLQEYSIARKKEWTKQNNNKQNQNDKINTTIKSNSDGRVCFKGGGMPVTSKNTVPLLHKLANFTSDNPLVAEALFAIVITCALRPASIMATAKTDEDKDKCKYQVAKSISTGLVGLGCTALIGTPVAAASKAANKHGAFKMPQEMKDHSMEIVKKGVDSLTDLYSKLSDSGENKKLAEQIKNLTDGGKINLSIFQKSGKGAEKKFINSIKQAAPEHLKDVKSGLKEQKIINNYSKTGKNVIDKLFQPLVLPVRAQITIAMVPILLGLLGIKKSNHNLQNKNQKPFNILNYNVFQTSNEKELFQSFSGVTGHENK